MKYTEHSFLVGESATNFAQQMGFKRESLKTNESSDMWNIWRNNNCQPNFWENVTPDPKTSCGPYQPKTGTTKHFRKSAPDPQVGPRNHDTIGMVVVDSNGDIACGVTTNGLTNKISGRVGDSPIAGKNQARIFRG